MMWKESYRLGVESIDRQHMELFRMTEELLKAIEDKREPEGFRKAVEFLKEYVIVHFRDEEAYQASIHYGDMKEHIRQHHLFIAAVQSFEQRLGESGYDLPVVKELAGMLTSWLIYHVADADQKLVRPQGEPEKQTPRTLEECLTAGIRNALGKMAGLASGDIQEEKLQLSEFSGDVVVEIELTGELPSKALFAFSKEFAFKLFETMTFIRPEKADEIVCSAMAEIANIICGNAVSSMALEGKNCGIRTPVISSGAWAGGILKEGLRVTTVFGTMIVAVAGI